MNVWAPIFVFPSLMSAKYLNPVFWTIIYQLTLSSLASPGCRNSSRIHKMCAPGTGGDSGAAVSLVKSTNVSEMSGNSLRCSISAENCSPYHSGTEVTLRFVCYVSCRPFFSLYPTTLPADPFIMENPICDSFFFSFRFAQKVDLFYDGFSSARFRLGIPSITLTVLAIIHCSS